MSIACSFSVPTITGSDVSLPSGNVSFAVCFSAMTDLLVQRGDSTGSAFGERARRPKKRTPCWAGRWMTTDEDSLLFERHERRRAERRREPVRVTDAEVTVA